MAMTSPNVGTVHPEAGAAFVMVTGVAPHDDERLALAKEFGADLAVDVGTDDPAKALRKETGGGADVVVDVTAKAPAALGQAVRMARTGGTVVLAGTRGSDETPGFDPDYVVYSIGPDGKDDDGDLTSQAHPGIDHGWARRGVHGADIGVRIRVTAHR